MNLSLLFNVFTGETSPLVGGNPDAPVCQLGARRLENFIPMPEGGLRKRPGTVYLMASMNSFGPSRLIAWLLSNGECAIVEISAGVIRVWTDPAQLFFLDAADLTEGRLAGIKHAAAADSLWLVHPETAPYNITWNGTVFAASRPSFAWKDFAAPGNYPACAAFHAGRLCLAGTDSEPNRIYLSRAPDSLTGNKRYTDFTMGALASDAIALDENDMHGSRLKWIAAGRRLAAGTDRAVWNDTGEVPTPSSFDMNIAGASGADGTQAVALAEGIVYAGRGGKSLRAMVWRNGDDGGGYYDTDISAHAAHLFGAGVKEIAVSQYPYPLAWIVTKAGELLSCTFDAQRGLAAYARHPTEGTVESIASAPLAGGDVLFLCVRRGDDRNIETLEFEDLANAEWDESRYADAGVTMEFDDPVTEVTLGPRFADRKVLAFADGAAEPPKTADAEGKITLVNPARKVYAGLPYASALSPNTRPLPANGTSLGKKKRVELITLRLYRSLGGKAGTDEEKAEALVTDRYGSYRLGEAPEPYTGDIAITAAGNIDEETRVTVLHEEPCPFTLLALVERVAVLEV